MLNFKKMGDLTPVAFRNDITFTINGVTLEEIIPEFKTIHIEGREVLSPRFTSVDKRHGAYMTKPGLDVRTLKVTYLMRCKDTASWNTAFLKLMKTLHHEEEVEISFSDDLGIFWLGKVTGFDIPSQEKLHVISTIEITCFENPFRHKAQVELTPDQINALDKSLFWFKPYKYILSGAGTANPRITLGNRIIEFTNVNSADVIELYPKDGEILVNGEPNVSILTANSDFSGIEVRHGDTVTSQFTSTRIIGREEAY